MISRRTYQIVSSVMVGCMFSVAWSEFQQGAEPADIHLITAAPLAPGALATGTVGSTVAFTGTGIHENAIIEARYFEPPHTDALPLDGVIHPWADAPRHRVMWRLTDG